MVNKVTSLPLFAGSPTSAEMEAIFDHMRAVSKKRMKDPAKSRRYLIEIGAIAPSDEPDVANPGIG